MPYYISDKDIDSLRKLAVDVTLWALRTPEYSEQDYSPQSFEDHLQKQLEKEILNNAKLQIEMSELRNSYIAQNGEVKELKSRILDAARYINRLKDYIAFVDLELFASVIDEIKDKLIPLK